jgi:hypothetical protein
LKKIKAYILAADPTWIECSVSAYYPCVDEIIVSYDRRGLGWTGAPVALDECLERLRAVDFDRKMKFVPGDFSGAVRDPMENDTLQRNVALQLASEDADWVLQLDTDEYLPSPAALLGALQKADLQGAGALEWPMRVLYRNLPGGRALEICARDGSDHFEYIAPVAVRSGKRLVHSRQTNGAVLRALVRGDCSSVQLSRPLAVGEVREELLNSGEAIIHNSWARSPADLRRKLASWSHASARAWIYYWARWLPSIWTWRWMRNLHPFFGGVWPALRVCPMLLPEGFHKGIESHGPYVKVRSQNLPAH